jgi:uncharacterized protein (TIGR02569 family)
MRPPEHVLEAFGAAGLGEKLAGGRGTAWRFGRVILKPLDVLPDELTWLEQIAASHPVPAFGISVPLRSRAGDLVVDGWTAFPLLEGEHRPGRWQEIAAVARAIAEQFEGVERPAFLDDRSHAWARADRLAWDEEEEVDLDGAPFLADLLAARRVVSGRPGIIHGDLAGNVLFDDSTRPAVIDFTPYWRPVQYSIAIVAVDAVCFEGAPLSLLHTIDDSDEFAQYLLRALVFRIATDRFNGLPTAHFAAYDDANFRVHELVGTARSDPSRIIDP